ncbi:MAG: DUF1902 domain-containing protein [Methylococcales bacterium]|nr:DUF1902 domain-containing protein [Methylococcales bacterium]
MKIKGMIARNGNVWVAMCLEFGLAAQALSEQEAKRKLQNQIQEYFDEAIGQDKAFQKQLLSRRAPFSWYARYYWLAVKDLCQNNKHSLLFSKSIDDHVSHA